jgi:hypothetical protein
MSTAIPVTIPSERSILTAARQEALEACASWLLAHDKATDTKTAIFAMNSAIDASKRAQDYFEQINKLPS